MALKIAILKETAEFEKRVAGTPEIVKRYVAKGLEVLVESGAGVSASFMDSDYEAAGAKIVKAAADATTSV